MAGERAIPILPCRAVEDVIPCYAALGFEEAFRQQRPNPYVVFHAAFAAGLREAFGKVPVAGIPRLLRPRRKLGSATGFSVVDPGGNWLRVYRDGASETTEAAPRGLELVLLSAARQSDARGEDAVAARMLDAGLARHPDAPAAVREEALAFRAELAERLSER